MRSRTADGWTGNPLAPILLAAATGRASLLVFVAILPPAALPDGLRVFSAVPCLQDKGKAEPQPFAPKPRPCAHV